MIWKDIPGFYGFYSASDEGLIKRNKRQVLNVDSIVPQRVPYPGKSNGI